MSWITSHMTQQNKEKFEEKGHNFSLYGVTISFEHRGHDWLSQSRSNPKKHALPMHQTGQSTMVSMTFLDALLPDNKLREQHTLDIPH
jgi:hypothetical protein